MRTPWMTRSVCGYWWELFSASLHATSGGGGSEGAMGSILPALPGVPGVPSPPGHQDTSTHYYTNTRHLGNH